MPPAISLSFKPGIGVVLVDRLPAQIRQPRLDVPSRNENGHALTRSATLLAAIGRGILDLSYPFLDRSTISVDHHNQGLFNSMLSRSVIGKFLRESNPHKLFP